MILVATVQHTGTHWLLGQFHRLGWTQRPLEEWSGDTPLAFCHLYDEMMPLVQNWRGFIVTTARPIEAIRDSFVRRGESLRALAAQILNWQMLLLRSPFIVEVEKWR